METQIKKVDQLEENAFNFAWLSWVDEGVDLQHLIDCDVKEAHSTLKKGLEILGLLPANGNDYLYGFASRLKVNCKPNAPSGYMIVKTLPANMIRWFGSFNRETLKGNGDCTLTGVFWDESFGDGVRKEYDRLVKSVGRPNLLFHQEIRQELARVGSESLFNEVIEQRDVLKSSSYFKDYALGNDFLFDREGHRLILTDEGTYERPY